MMLRVIVKSVGFAPVDDAKATKSYTTFDLESMDDVHELEQFVSAPLTYGQRCVEGVEVVKTEEDSP